MRPRHRQSGVAGVQVARAGFEEPRSRAAFSVSRVVTSGAKGGGVVSNDDGDGVAMAMAMVPVRMVMSARARAWTSLELSIVGLWSTLN